MKSTDPIEGVRDEVLRKIGRNVVLFQQLEGLMKALAASRNISGPVSRLAHIRDTKRAEIDNQTMGQLVGKLQEELYSSDDEQEAGSSPVELSEAWMSFSFRIESDSTFVDSRSKALADIVASRNELIHKLLPRWKFDSLDDCHELERYLDEQVVSVREEIAACQALIKAIKEQVDTLKEYLDSDAGLKAIERSWLQQSLIVLMLGDIARQRARPDGWAYISTAGHILKQKAPEEFAAIGTRYKKRNLLELILAAELFEVVKEQNATGGARFLYRISPDWTLTSNGA